MSDTSKTNNELDQALEILRQLPRPNPEQIEEFVEYFKSRRSWYKHLPMLSGEWFIFYLNPTAGYGEQSMHYIYTEQERADKCGYLDFVRCGEIPEDKNPQDEIGYPSFGIRRAAEGTSEKLYVSYRIPDPLRAIGAVRLNAFVRRTNGIERIWKRRLLDEIKYGYMPKKFQWPDGAGGPTLFEAMLTHAEEHGYIHEDLLGPPMRYQQQLIRQAINQMLDYVYDGIVPEKTWLQ